MQDTCLMLQYIHPKVIYRGHCFITSGYVMSVPASHGHGLLCLIICDHVCIKRYFTYKSRTRRHHIYQGRGITLVLRNHTVQCDGNCLFYCRSLHFILTDLILYECCVPYSAKCLQVKSGDEAACSLQRL